MIDGQRNSNPIFFSRKFDDNRSSQVESIIGSNSVEVERDWKVYNFTLVMTGNLFVGKTSILSKFISNKVDKNYRCTIGVKFEKKTIVYDEKTKIELTLMDTCGEEKYKAMTQQYYRKANGIILVFDLTDRKSFDSLLQWVTDIHNYSSDEVEIFVLGNKCDLDQKRVVSKEEVMKLLGNVGLAFYKEVSAKNGNEIESTFYSISKILLEKELKSRKKDSPQTMSLEEGVRKKRRCC